MGALFSSLMAVFDFLALAPEVYYLNFLPFLEYPVVVRYAVDLVTLPPSLLLATT